MFFNTLNGEKKTSDNTKLEKMKKQYLTNYEKNSVIEESSFSSNLRTIRFIEAEKNSK